MSKKIIRTDFDAIVVGGGPAGALFAFELNMLRPDLRVLILEKGKKRSINDKDNNLFGWLGAGAFSDGKLTLTSKTGGQLVNKGYITAEEFNGLMGRVESVYHEFGGAQEEKIGNDEKIKELTRRASAAGLELIPYPVKHWGREGAYKIAENLYKHLKERKVEIMLNSEAVSIKNNSENENWQVTLKNKREFQSHFLILATGRAGADWTVKQLKKHGVETENNPMDGGVRVEVKKNLLEELTDNLYDFKLKYLTRERRDEVRTFCVCPGGKVVKEQHEDFAVVNGQTDKKNQTENTNFAILVSISFTEPFNDANDFGRKIAKLSTDLSYGSVLIQTLADWQNKRRSKSSSFGNFPVKPTLLEAAPGDLRLALPERIFAAINEMIEALGRFVPGLSIGNNLLLYGAEVKFYSKKVIFRDNFETGAKNLFVIGDGSGVTRGLAQSSIMGIKTARDIVKKIKF